MRLFKHLALSFETIVCSDLHIVFPDYYFFPVDMQGMNDNLLGHTEQVPWPRHQGMALLVDHPMVHPTSRRTMNDPAIRSSPF